MIDWLAHRGPIDEGLFNCRRDQVSVQLAHRRLSIIDLSIGAHRPLTVDGLTVCYNAELYYDLPELVDDVHLSGDLVGRGLLQQGPVHRLVAEERSGREEQSKQIWQLLTLEFWCRHAAASGAATP